VIVRRNTGELARMSWEDYFIGMARWVAFRADCTRRRIGCVLVDADNRVIATGYNGAPAGDPGCLSGACPRGQLSYDEVPKDSDYDNCIAIHAEANALLYARASVKGATAYITDKPCPSCHKLLRGAGIERIVYP
jgi:dCMP deaminase